VDVVRDIFGKKAVKAAGSDSECWGVEREEEEPLFLIHPVPQ
jgi:hypothetical protein